MPAFRMSPIRLIATAIALVVAVGCGAPRRAAHELRGLIDTAAEIAGPRTPTPRPARAAHGERLLRLAPARGQPIAVGQRPLSIAKLVPGADRLGMPTWPAAWSGRHVVALKRARLI
jgi:hypothetical protein